jgi:hypothetical protein
MREAEVQERDDVRDHQLDKTPAQRQATGSGYLRGGHAVEPCRLTCPAQATCVPAKATANATATRCA